MVVYDRVIPNAAFPSLYALTAGMMIVLIFDFILKNMRKHSKKQGAGGLGGHVLLRCGLFFIHYLIIFHKT